MILIALVDTCQAKAGLIGTFFLKISQLLPTSPVTFRVAYLVDMINTSTPWGLGGVITELLSGIVDYLRLVVAWKIVGLLINVLGSKL